MEHLISTSCQNHLKTFIIATKQYSNTHDESSFNAIFCSLQVLGQSSNQLVFNSKSTLIQDFFINLYELMNNTKDDSDLMWAAINVLQSIVKQRCFYESKLNNYNFTLILTKLLKDQLSPDKKIKVLKLLQELTYGVKLQWQEGFLSELIILLVKWISSEDKDLVSFSLGVLMNVCYKNKFAMFTLVKYTHSKSFMRLLLKLQSNDIFMKIQVYKLLLVLEQVSGEIPHVDINNLIDVTFIVLEEGLKSKNFFVLRHAVDFFIDISEHSQWKNYVYEYSNYISKLNNILEAMCDVQHIETLDNNDNNTFKSIDLILHFIHHTLKLRNEDFIGLYPKIIIHILHWIQFLDLHQKAMSILQSIIINVRIFNNNINQNLQFDIYQKLEESLNVLLICLLEPNSYTSTSDVHIWNKNAMCLKLLQEMLKLPNLCEKIEEKLSVSSFQSILYSLLQINIEDLNNLQNIAFIYLEALCLLSDLVAKNPMWMSLYSDVLNQKHVYNVLAFIIYNGTKNMKQKVLDLITKFSQQSTLMLSDCLEEIQHLSSTKVKQTINSKDTEVKPLCLFVQEEHLQMFINKLENMFKSNEIHNIKTSDVIKLYQFKINSLRQTEVWLKQSLDNASKEITQLNYKTNCLNCESMQLNQMLLENHQAIDELTMENSELKKKLNNILEQFSITSNKFAKLSQNYESKCKIIKDQDSSIKILEEQFKELQIESDNIKSNLLDQLQNEKTENKIKVSKLEQQLIDKQSIINEKTEEIDNKASFIRNLENCMLEKENDVIDLRKQLQEQHRVREMISQMLAATSSKPQFLDK